MHNGIIILFNLSTVADSLKLPRFETGRKATAAAYKEQQ